MHHLAADVDVGVLHLEGEAREHHPFEDLVGILLDQEPVLERAGLGLVGVAEEVDGLSAALLLRRDEGPLHAAGEAGAAAAAEARGLHHVRDLRGVHSPDAAPARTFFHEA